MLNSKRIYMNLVVKMVKVSKDEHFISNNNENEDKNLVKDENYNQQLSPMLIVIEESKGGKTFYAVLSCFFLIIIFIKILLTILCEKEKLNNYTFFYRQLSESKYLFQLIFVQHVILYFFTYPIGKYLSKNKIIYLITTLMTLCLLKFSIYSLIYTKVIHSIPIRVVASCDNVRCLMKCISFWIEVSSSHTKSSEITISKFTYFLFAPSLIYQSTYKRTNNKSINWKNVIIYMTEVVVMSIIFLLWLKEFYSPAFTEHLNILRQSDELNEIIVSIIRFYLYNIINSIMAFLYIAFAIIHSCSNAQAELCCYYDRNFYKDWWVSHSGSETLRKWNTLVGSWLRKYIYNSCLEKLGLNRILSTLIVLTISGLYHDYVKLITLKTPGLVFTCLMPMSIFPMLLTPKFKKLPLMKVCLIQAFYGLFFNGIISFVIAEEYIFYI